MDALWQQVEQVESQVDPNRASKRALWVSVFAATLVLALGPRGEGALAAFCVLWAGIFGAALLQILLTPTSSAPEAPDRIELLKRELNERRRGWGLEPLPGDDPRWGEILAGRV